MQGSKRIQRHNLRESRREIERIKQTDWAHKTFDPMPKVWTGSEFLETHRGGGIRCCIDSSIEPDSRCDNIGPKLWTHNFQSWSIVSRVEWMNEYNAWFSSTVFFTWLYPSVEWMNGYNAWFSSTAFFTWLYPNVEWMNGCNAWFQSTVLFTWLYPN